MNAGIRLGQVGHEFVHRTKGTHSAEGQEGRREWMAAGEQDGPGSPASASAVTGCAEARHAFAVENPSRCRQPNNPRSLYAP